MDWKLTSKSENLTRISNSKFKYFFSKEKSNGKSTSPIFTNLPGLTTQHVVAASTASKLDQNDPPTKLIKLINGSAILAPIDSKDNNKQMLHSGQLTLQQVCMQRIFVNWIKFNLIIFKVVGGGGLVVSPIQLLTSQQGFKVINQPNGLTTIELSPQSKL